MKYPQFTAGTYFTNSIAVESNLSFFLLLSRAHSPYYSVRDVHRCITRHVTLRPTSLLRETTKPCATIITLGIVHCLRLTLHMTLRRSVLLPFSIGRSPMNRGVILSPFILRLLVTVANRCMTHECQYRVLTTLSAKQNSFQQYKC